MKNNFLFLVCLGLVLLSSCKDDDKDPFKNYSTDYTGSKLALTFNGKEMTGKAVSFRSLNQDNASIALKGMIPGEDSLVINMPVVALENDNFSFEGENKNADRTVGVKGEVKGGVLNLNTTFKVTSKVVGKWTSPEAVEGKTALSPVYFELETQAVESVTLPILMWGGEYDELNEPILDLPMILPIQDGVDEWGQPVAGFATMLKFVAGMILPQYLYSVELKEDGNLVATYSDGGETPVISEEGLVRYNVKDGQIYLLIDIVSLMAKSESQQPDITKMLSSGIPLKLTVNDEQLIAYVDKSMMVPFMSFVPMVKELIKDMEPINMGLIQITSTSLSKFLDEVANLVTTADRCDLGLSLVPAKVEEPTPAPQAFSISLGKSLKKLVK